MYTRVLVVLFISVCQQCRSDSVINSFVDRYLDNLWTEAKAGQSCFQHFSNKVFNDVGKSSLKVSTSNAATGFLCSSKRNGDVSVKQSGNQVEFEIPLKVNKIIFNFENVKISSSDLKSEKDLGQVDFQTDGDVSIKIKFVLPQKSSNCKTNIDVDIVKLNDFKCFIKGDRNDMFESWINSNVKPKFSAYMEKQYWNFLDKLDICNYLIRYVKPEKLTKSNNEVDNLIEEIYEED